jgi:putative FmdB family regulatory protein
VPLFEYRCRECDRRFELFVSGQTPAACPGCESDDVQKLLSVFAVGNGGSARPSAEATGGCGSCGDPRGPGACSMN